MKIRPRRLRQSETIRQLVRESTLDLGKLVYPVFVKATPGQEPIEAMPGQMRFGLSDLIEYLKPLYDRGLRSFALFPVIEGGKKTADGAESLNPSGLGPTSLKKLKEIFPHALLFADVALDPFTNHGHDGLVHDGRIINDETVEILQRQATLLAQAGADFVCPSDMMDGRIGAIRKALDRHGLKDTGILSYCAKYASSFYGPFREALNSKPRSGDKKTYQMDPSNRREALRELELDLSEGADIVMVKPAMAYLDIISDFKQRSSVPVAAYQVSGEYAMIMATAERGWINPGAAILESLTSIHRAGADIIFTYFAPQVLELFQTR